MSTFSRVILIPLFRDMSVATNGSPLSKTTLDLDVPRVRELLPHAEAIFLIVNTGGLPTAAVVDWNVAFISGFGREHVPPSAVDISSSAFDVDGAKRSAEYTTLTNFLPDTRLQAWWRNASGVNGPKSAALSAILGVRLFGN